ncbi:universal stress protein [Streptomyces sp. NBC_01294]|uniref:universal stress protein n=1 Tax=Streptomyces sp. NBC_01294 TaxID=2903815 RepID=UPI002DD93904|nr:universal stress protein [Streptomyces sp. NBC_01294]WRZ55314.1 universal stress protein [Streptomyces sp. NBC_01294]WRZ61382.1 universal stress protein [Streptomyces sp. NBC_01294]
MRRVVVGVTGSPGSLTALHRAAAEARVRDAELRVVLAWQSPGGELGSRNGLGPAALEECRAAAVERLREVLGTAFGAAKAGVTLAGLTVRGTAGAALVDTARGPEDLLVVGTGSRAPLRRLVRPSVARYCLAHAACPVLVVPPSPLQAEPQSVHRRNVWRIPLDPREPAP